MLPRIGLPDYRCSQCGEHSDSWASHCPRCQTFGSVDRPEKPHKAVKERAPTLADAKIVRHVRISTEIVEVDRVLGTDWKSQAAGFCIPSIALLAGGEGCGKTTLLLKVAALCRSSLLYLSTEQTIDAIRDTAERIGLSDSLDRIQAKRIETLNDAMEMMHKHKPRIVVIDSISDLTDPERDTGDTYANTVRMTQALKLEAEKNRRAIVCMVHLNNDDSIAGLRKLKHKVDAVVRLDAFGEELRLLHCPEKNRYGKIGVKSWFMMTDRGLVPCDAPENDPTQKRPPATI